MNAAASEIVQRSDGLAVDRNRLVCVRQADAVRLRELVTSSSDGALRVSRIGGRRPYQLWVTHSNPSEVIVLIVDAERVATGAEMLLELFYDLTPAESRLAAHLMNGCSLAEAAKQLRIRRDTAKSHLKKIFSKTHTHRQSELVRLLLQSVAALRIKSQKAEFVKK